MRHPATLVFDIGKTTKKALLFDSSFSVVEEITDSFAEINDDHGFPCENLPLLTAWMRDLIRKFLKHDKYEITHLNFSAYGASLVSVDNSGEPLLPFYSYLKPCPVNIASQFYEEYISNKTLLQETASPWLEFLNSGVQAYWLRHCQPERMAKTQWLLHLPQFLSFLTTGVPSNEKTSLGCHTLLWNFNTQTYHDWVIREGLDRLFPKVRETTHAFQHSLLGRPVAVGVGVHDSSSALMPYLVTHRQPFLMLSTGTWNICFNPFNRSPLTEDELAKDCLSYLTWEGQPVKASRIFLGHEHELQQRKLAQHFNVPDDLYKTVTFNEELFNRLRQVPGKKFQPVGMAGSGPMPEAPASPTDYNAFADFEEAQHQLMIDIAEWQKVSIDLVDKGGMVQDIIVVGGFTKSKMFLETLKRVVPARTFYLSQHPRASALGAAWLVHDVPSMEKHSDILKINRL